MVTLKPCKNNGLRACANPIRLFATLGVRVSIGVGSEDEGPVEIHRPKFTVLSDLAAAHISHPVQAEIIFGQINLREKPSFKVFKLHEIDLALEDRFLHALASPLAHLRDPPQASATGLRFGTYIVANDDQHD